MKTLSMKKIILSMALVALIALCPLCLMACGKQEEKPVESIEIVGTFKSDYYINEGFDYANIQLKVVYDDESSAIIPVTESMILGFNSSEPVESSTVTIVYKNQTIKKDYSVNVIKFGVYAREGYLNNKLDYYADEYVTFNKDGTIAGTNQVWRYEDGKFKIFSEMHGSEGEDSVMVFEIVSPTKLKMVEGENEYTLLCFRHAA